MTQNIILKTLKIDGMTCVNCENKIERMLSNTIGIISATVSYSKGDAQVTFDSNVISLKEIETTIEQLDYKVITPEKKEEKKEEKKSDIINIVGVLIIIYALYIMINHFGGFRIFNAFPVAEAGMGYGMLLLIGLLTSVHCVAMCGGICLSQCVPKNPENGLKVSRSSALRPSILYNSGRVISYTVIGGIVGAIGSLISFSGTMKGIVQIAAGVFMVIMGINMLNLFPWLRKFNPRMPKFIAKKINAGKASNSPFFIGLLNGLMPCGPLQAMQLYALSTGNPLQGALSMFLFSIGTVPLMFGFGALSSYLSKKFTSKMLTVSAILVVVLGVFMFGNGISLSGITLPTSTTATKNSSAAVIDSGVQIVTTKLSSGRYEPITVQKGIPVKWTIQASDGDINGCNKTIIIPKYNIEYQLQTGDNIIEFTPTESGTIPFSCWMGMIKSKITVVDDITKIDSTNSNGLDSVNNKANYSIPTDKIAVAEIKDGVQYVKIDMSTTGFSPAVVVLQSGIATTWIINGTKIDDSNSSVVFPKYNAQIDMKEGENPINFTPEADFDFSTIDNSLFGYVKVVDDINNVDINSIKSEVKKYVPTIQDNNGTGDTETPSCCNPTS